MKKIVISVSIVTVVLAAIILGFSNTFVVREHGPKSVNKLYIPDVIRGDIENVVRKKENLVGLQIVTIHFQRNIRIETLMTISNETVQVIYDRYINSRVIETPFFNSDPENNTRMLRLINGEFVCVPYEKSIAYTIAPAALEYVKSVCAIGIPPHNHGEFTGIITLYLAAAPAPGEIETLFLFVRDLSVKIDSANKLGSVYNSQR